jgi:DNA helicase-2/ATP-dependent DNA helicase PcrA
MAAPALRRLARATLGLVLVASTAHAQSRLIEQRLAQERVPYRVFGGTPFFSKKEVKDLLAYLWVVVNPRDAVNLERAVLTPRRGFGETSLAKAVRESSEKGLPLFDTLRQGLGLSAGSRKKLDDFFTLLDELRDLAGSGGLFEVASHLVERTAYRDHLIAEGREDRGEIVDEFLSLLADFDRFQGNEDSAAGPGLVRFLEGVSLAATVDGHTPDSGRLTLMTVHNAKGLEFPYVLLTGLEEKLFPHASSLDDPLQLEEERRLFYVGMTRTEVELFLTYARQRTIRGVPSFQMPSRFLSEIGRENLRMTNRGFVPPPRPARQTIDPIYED